MTEEFLSLDRQKNADSIIQSEQDYIDNCVQYALSGGWVKETEKDILIDKYLKPIYQKYLEVIADLKKEMTNANELAAIITKMNFCLETTRRIGSTDPNNILRSIQDIKRSAQDTYSEYAIASLAQAIAEIVNN